MADNEMSSIYNAQVVHGAFPGQKGSSKNIISESLRNDSASCYCVFKQAARTAVDSSDFSGRCISKSCVSVAVPNSI